MSSSQYISILEPYQVIIWSWYILENHTLADTYLLLQQHYFDILTSTQGTFPSMRSLQYQLQRWGFRKNTLPLKNIQLCQRIYVLFYDLGLTDHEILLFLQRERYDLSIHR